MAKNTTTDAPTEDEWTDVNRGLGTTVVFNDPGDEFIGFFLGAKEGIETADKFNPGQKRLSTALQFAPEIDPEGLCFIWQNGILENAFEEITQGEKVRVIFEGIEFFKDKITGEPRNTKRYRVQVAGRK